MFIFPPAFSIFDKACFEAKLAEISIFFLISPVPNIFNFKISCLQDFFPSKFLNQELI